MSRLPIRLAPHRHRDDRIETVIKRDGAFYDRVIFDPRKCVTREDYIQGLVEYVTRINQKVARLQRVMASSGPTIEMDDDEEESH